MALSHCVSSVTVLGVLGVRLQMDTRIVRGTPETEFPAFRCPSDLSYVDRIEEDMVDATYIKSFSCCCQGLYSIIVVR